MPPAPHEYQGGAAIASFLRASAGWRGGRRSGWCATRANTQPAFGCYLNSARAPIAQAAGLIVLTLDGERVSAITRFLDLGVLHRFGLHQTLPGNSKLAAPVPVARPAGPGELGRDPG